MACVSQVFLAFFVLSTQVCNCRWLSQTILIKLSHDHAVAILEDNDHEHDKIYQLSQRVSWNDTMATHSMTLEPVVDSWTLHLRNRFSFHVGAQIVIYYLFQFASTIHLRHLNTWYDIQNQQCASLYVNHSVLFFIRRFFSSTIFTHILLRLDL